MVMRHSPILGSKASVVQNENCEVCFVSLFEIFFRFPGLAVKIIYLDAHDFNQETVCTLTSPDTN